MRNKHLFIRIIKWLLLLTSFVVAIVILLFFFPPAPSQQLDTRQLAAPPGMHRISYNIDSLALLYGTNKILARGYEIQCLLALSVYPELTESHIEFVLQDGGAPMESSFDYLSLLGQEKSRRYKILLNDSPQPSFLEPILLRNLPFDAQVGILAHELGHTMYYRELNLFQILSWAMNYGLRPSYRALHERSTDELTVFRGLGWQILEYAEFVRYDSTTRELYSNGKDFMDTFYLTPEEIEKAMKKSGMYQ